MRGPGSSVRRSVLATAVRHVCTAALIILGGTAGSIADDGPVASGESGKAISTFVRNAHDRLGFTGTVLAAKDGKVVAAVAVGSTGGRSPEPLTTTTLFEIASSTKAFTSVATLRLRDQGKLKLDDSIADHLPGVPENCRAITIRHLLQHTSGIPNTNMHGAGNDLATVLPQFLKGGPRRPPGTRHQYWNQGYGLLSEIVARAAGKPYVEACHDEIFAPCRMRSSCFTGSEPPDGVSVATGRSVKGSPRSALDHPYGEYGFQYRGTGGLVSNVWDLWRFDRALADGKFLPATTVKEMTSDPIGGYMLGWQLAAAPDGQPYHHHNGSVRGFMADIRRYPSIDGCLIVLSSSDVYTEIDQVLTGCEQLLFGRDLKIELPKPVEQQLLTQVEGKFVDGTGRTLIIASDGRFARSLILWGGAKRTPGFLSPDMDGALVFLFRDDPAIPVAVQLDRQRRATKISMLGMEFERQLGQ